jgi:hypothetical protein
MLHVPTHLHTSATIHLLLVTLPVICAVAACRRPDAPAGGGKGWELSWTLTTPLVPKDERDAPIELGELLGAGSFGESEGQQLACRTACASVVLQRCFGWCLTKLPSVCVAAAVLGCKRRSWHCRRWIETL